MPRKKGVPNMHHQAPDRLTIRINADVKAEFESRCNAAGVSMTERLNALIAGDLQRKAGKDGPETPQA